MKTFLKMMKYELKRVCRNKIVLTMLLTFSIVLVLLLSFMQATPKNFSIALYTDGVNIEESSVLDIIGSEINLNKVTIVDSEEEGLNLIKKGKVCFFIRVKSGEVPEESTAIFYYDQTSIVARSIKNNIEEIKNEYAYYTLLDFLYNYGITLKEFYFQPMVFEPAIKKEVSIKQMPYAMEVGTCISIILMFGLAYSMSRDNETNVSKNLSYMPVGTNRYLWAKIIPYFILGVVQLMALYIIGILFFKIQFETNFFIVLGLTSTYVLAVIALSLIFSMLKSQIATIFLDMIMIIFPLFEMTMVYLQVMPFYIQFLLNCCPLVPFISLLNAMMFNGVILWKQVGILLVQSIIYYLIAILIIKRKVKE